MGDEACGRNRLYVGRASEPAEKLHQLALLRGEFLHLRLVIRGKEIDGFQDRLDQVGLFVISQKLVEDHKNTMIAVRQLLDGSDSCPAFGRGDIIRDVTPPLTLSQSLKQGYGVLYGQALKGLDLEEAVKR